MISYLTLGSEEGSPLVFIHGLGAGKKQIGSALTNLPGRRLITPNMPGHGDSPEIDPSQFSFDFFADLVIEVMDHLGIDQTDLGGLSMGSGISLNIALRYPERVKKLILLRPSWLDSPRPHHLELVDRGRGNAARPRVQRPGRQRRRGQLVRCDLALRRR